jgi:hypothetical protein
VVNNRKEEREMMPLKVKPSEYSPRGTKESVKIQGHPDLIDLKQSRM